MEAAPEIADDDHARELGRQIRELAIEDRNLELVHREQALQAVRLCAIVNDEHHAVAVALPPGETLDDRPDRRLASVASRDRREAVGDEAPHPIHRRARPGEHLDHVELDRREPLARAARFFRREIEILRARHEPVSGGGCRGMVSKARGELLLRGLDGGRLFDPDECARRTIVGEDLERGLDQRQQERAPREHEPRLHAVERRESLRPGDVEIGRARLDGPARAGIGPALERVLAPRCYQGLGETPERALRGRIERADRFDHVAVELKPKRQRLDRGEHVDDAAPHGELAAVFDLRHPVIAGAREPLGDALEADLLPFDPSSSRARAARRAAACVAGGRPRS